MALIATDTAVAAFIPQRPANGQGRPRSDAASDVPLRIFEAAQRIIDEKGHFDVTDKEIARAAGVSVAMINYYFESKDGLLFALVDQLCAEIAVTLKEAEQKAKDLANGARGQTRDLIRMLVRAYHSRPSISRIMMSEIARENSIVRERFVKRYGSRAMQSLKRIFESLIESGIYDRRIDTDHAALALLSDLNAPIVITKPIRPSGRPIGPGLDEQETERWIDFLSDMFDRQFKNRHGAGSAA